MTGTPLGIRVRGLAFHWPDGTPALRGVDLEVEPGTRLAVLGPNGAGKSTLLLHLAGLLPGRRYPHAHRPGDPEHRHGTPGEVRIGGRSWTDRDAARELRREVGIVFEDPDDQLFCLTVAEDVAWGLRVRGIPPAEADRRAEAALRRVGLPGRGERPPHHLSRGEKRRACLAGVLVLEPGVLLLDEPTSGLDPRGRRELAELLRGLPATQLVATHDLSFARALCPEAVILDGGRVVAGGPTETLLDDRDLLLAHGLA